MNSRNWHFELIDSGLFQTLHLFGAPRIVQSWPGKGDSLNNDSGPRVICILFLPTDISHLIFPTSPLPPGRRKRGYLANHCPLPHIWRCAAAHATTSQSRLICMARSAFALIQAPPPTQLRREITAEVSPVPPF
jgi:hypothetical protein